MAAAPISVKLLGGGSRIPRVRSREHHTKNVSNSEHTHCSTPGVIPAGSYWVAAKEPLQTLITRNDLGAGGAPISVQLLGGGSRVPRVRSELQSVHSGITLEKNLDASEAFALGGGLFAANLSTTFRLRQFGMLDVSPYAVAVSLDIGGDLPAEFEACFRSLALAPCGIRSVAKQHADVFPCVVLLVLG